MLESSHIPEQQVPHYRTYIKSLGSHELIQEYRAVTDGSPISKYRSNNLRETRESKIIPGLVVQLHKNKVSIVLSQVFDRGLNHHLLSNSSSN